MATFRKRGNKWQVIVRHIGNKQQSKCFSKKSDAVLWAKEIERTIERSVLPCDIEILSKVTFIDLMERYEKLISPNKKSASSDHYTIRVFKGHSFVKKPIGSITSRDFVGFRDKRLTEAAPSTVRRNLALARHIYEVAIKEWNYPISINPVEQITIPKQSLARVRRLEGDELDRLLVGCDEKGALLLKSLILFAIETGMRRGEIVNSRWSDFDFGRSTLYIPDTKNGLSRTIPLSRKAKEIIQSQEREGEFIFPMSGNAIRLAWERLKKLTCIDDLRFHDLRHEAISRFFEKGLSVPEVALISGHKDLRMLFRYTHLKAEDIVKKLMTLN